MSKKLLALAATACAMSIAPAAYAAPVLDGSSVDFTGYFQANGNGTLAGATSLDFVNGPAGAASPGAAGTVPSFGSGTGTFAGFSCTGGSCGTIADLANFTVGAQSIANFFSLTGGNLGSAINFDLANISNISRGNANGDTRFLSFVANGTLRYDGFNPTPATFLFSSQGSTATSFSATVLSTAAVPEAATWGMMIAGFGLVGTALRTRRRAQVSFA